MLVVCEVSRPTEYPPSEIWQMQSTQELVGILQDYFIDNHARLTFIASYLLALIKTRSVNGTMLADAFTGYASSESVYRRIQRFFAECYFGDTHLAAIVLSLAKKQEYRGRTGFILCIDRTIWQIGSLWVNILMVSVVQGDTSYPLVWMFLPKRGNSSTTERMTLMERVLAVLPPEQILCLTADREFIGHQWFQWLRRIGIDFSCRIRANTTIRRNKSDVHISTLFAHLPLNTTLCCGRINLMGCRLWVSGCRLEDDYCIVVSATLPDDQALELYAKRWAIETLFAGLKSRGFHLEETHMTKTERLSTLLNLLALAFVWAHLVGEWLAAQRAIALKKHGRKAKSTFRLGLDFMRKAALNLHSQKAHDDLKDAIKILSCT